MYKKDLALNNLQCLIPHKTKAILVKEQTYLIHNWRYLEVHTFSRSERKCNVTKDRTRLFHAHAQAL